MCQLWLLIECSASSWAISAALMWLGASCGTRMGAARATDAGAHLFVGKHQEDSPLQVLRRARTPHANG
jgi:hypothetical protein